MNSAAHQGPQHDTSPPAVIPCKRKSVGHLSWGHVYSSALPLLTWPFTQQWFMNCFDNFSFATIFLSFLLQQWTAAARCQNTAHYVTNSLVIVFHIRSIPAAMTPLTLPPRHLTHDPLVMYTSIRPSRGSHIMDDVWSSTEYWMGSWSVVAGTLSTGGIVHPFIDHTVSYISTLTLLAVLI